MTDHPQASQDPQAIFITGAASGIGRETAKLFASQGWRVGAADLDEMGLASLAGELGPDRCQTGRLDVRDAAAYKARLDAFAAWTGNRLDVLFNCAGIMTMSPFEETPLAIHVRTVEVNVLGVLNGIHTAFPLLKATPGAHIVTMCSASALYGVPDLATYSASKFFIRGLTEGLSIEFEKHGITVTDLMPLYVDTPMVRDPDLPRRQPQDLRSQAHPATDRRAGLESRPRQEGPLEADASPEDAGLPRRRAAVRVTADDEDGGPAAVGGISPPGGYLDSFVLGLLRNEARNRDAPEKPRVEAPIDELTPSLH